MNNISNDDINNSIAQINMLIEQSSDSLLCDSQCQTERNANILKEKYLRVKNSLETAPSRILETQKNYYVFVNGENEYNEFLEQELSKKADVVIDSYSNIFNELKENAEILSNELEIIKENSINTYDLYNDYIKNNRIISKKFKLYESDVFTNFRKTYYEVNEYENVLTKYNFYYRFYYIFSFIYIILLFIYGRKIYSMKTIIILIIIVLIYPYFINYLVQLILGTYYYFQNKIVKYTPYTDYTDLVLTKSRNVILKKNDNSFN